MAREHTRFRKYKQVLEDKLVSAELSLRYWAQQEKFWAWVSILVSERVTPELLRGREQALIQTLQPPLNFPFIARWFCRKRIIKPPDATFARKTGMFRLWRKKRRKQALQHAAAESRGLPAPLYAIFDKPAFRTKEATWVLLTQLGSNTLQHFEAAKRLRNNGFSFAALCALRRPAKHLPAYMAPVAFLAITSALQLRGHLAPKCYRPLRVPFMTHAAYRNELRTCVRAYISGCIKAPFHVPYTVAFPRHLRVAQALYNHQDALRRWAAKHQPSCRCEAIKRHAPEAPTYDGHAVASGFHFQCGLSTLERQVISGSSGDTFFPGKRPIWEQFRQAWASWCATITIYRDLPGILSRCFMRCGRSMLKRWPQGITIGLWTT